MSSQSSSRKRSRTSMFTPLKRVRLFDTRPKRAFIRPRAGTSAVVKGVVVSGPLGPERKKFDSSQGVTGVNTAAPFVLSLLNGINEGTSVNQRVGQRIHVKALDLNIQCSAGSTLTLGTGPQFLDAIIVWDKQPNEATATASQIFQNASTNLTFLNTQNLERFQVLKRVRINFDIAGSASYAGEFHIPCEMGARYSDASGTSPNTNDLVFVALSNNVASAGDFPGFQFNWRITFTDE